jgi:hypothetical protein
MSRSDGFSAVRNAVAAGALAVYAVWAFAQGPAEGPGRVAGPEDVRAELWSAQFAAPPGEGTLACDAGAFVFEPDGTDPDADVFAQGLLSDTDAAGKTVWPVTAFEDRATRDTVFLNVCGDEILRLPPPPEYSPRWILDALYPGGGDLSEAAAACDPARVVMTARLLFPGSAEEEGRTGASGQAEAGRAPRRAAPSAGGSAGSGVSGPVGSFAVPAVSAAGAAALNAAKNASAFSVSGANAASMSDPTNPPHASPVPAARGRCARTVFVDRSEGRDSWTGRASAAHGASEGPKRTLRAGLASLRKDDTLVVKPGAYSESFDVRGRKANVRFRGNVVLTREYEDAAAAAAAFSASEVSSSTGAVASAAN